MHERRHTKPDAGLVICTRDFHQLQVADEAIQAPRGGEIRHIKLPGDGQHRSPGGGQVAASHGPQVLCATRGVGMLLPSTADGTHEHRVLPAARNARLVLKALAPGSKHGYAIVEHCA